MSRIPANISAKTGEPEIRQCMTRSQQSGAADIESLESGVFDQPRRQGIMSQGTDEGTMRTM